MTFFELVKQCLQKEAVRTEPDKQFTIQKVLKEFNKNGKAKCDNNDQIYRNSPCIENPKGV